MEDSQSQHATVAAIQRGLRQVLKRGLLPAHLVKCDAFPALKALRARTEGSGPYDRAFGLERLLRDALVALGDGPYGEAAQLLFGAVPGARGLPLKERRRQAAEALNHLMASTFRQNYEDDMVRDVAVEVLRIELGV